MRLTARDRKDFRDVLLAAFQTWEDLNAMTTLYLDTPLQFITAPSAIPNVVLTVITWAEARSRIPELVEAAREANPTNTELRDFATRLLATLAGPSSAATQTQLEQTVVKAEFSTSAEAAARDQGRQKTTVASQITSEALQRIALRSVDFFNTEDWRKTMAARECAVCRIEFPCETGQATGFLIAPGLVMTNYHVLESFITKARMPSEICCRFGYKKTDAQAEPDTGKAFTLVDQWLVASSPVDQLDYAIVRLAGADGAVVPDALKAKSHDFETGESLFIIQHPKAAPLKVASGGVVKAEATRVFYLANTLKGSSGSPCFTSNWELVALHRSGEDVANVGVPFAAIAQDLTAKNLGTILS